MIRYCALADTGHLSRWSTRLLGGFSPGFMDAVPSL